MGDFQVLAAHQKLIDSTSISEYFHPKGSLGLQVLLVFDPEPGVRVTFISSLQTVLFDVSTHQIALAILAMTLIYVHSAQTLRISL